MKHQRTVILASSSEPRKRLLEQIGITFEVHPSDYEEDHKAKKDPGELVQHLAQGKARDIAQQYEDAVIIGADNVIAYDGKIFGKPKDTEDATRMLKTLSDNTHQALSGFCIIDTASGEERTGRDATSVTFRKITDEEIQRYIATGEPFSKAGAYAMQQRGGIFIKSIEGDPFAVIGLPLNQIASNLQALDVQILEK